MANLEATPLFRPNPLTNGGTFIQGWQDLANDNGSQSTSLYWRPGSAFIGAQVATTQWTRSARSVETVSGIFTVVLRAPFSFYAYMGLNTEGNSPTYPANRYARAKYAVTTSQVALISGVSRVFELGVNKGSNVNWNSTGNVSWAICDTGSAIIYKYSTDDCVTWNTHYTSLATYVPNQVYRVDVGVSYGNQNVMVEVYPSVLV